MSQLFSEIVFVHIPKTGGQSIWSWVSKYYTKYESNPFILAGEKHHSFLYEDKNYNNIKEVIAVVRNPWDRAVSAYKFIKQEKGGAYFSPKLIEEISFNEFIKRMIEIDMLLFKKNKTWTYFTPQINWIDNSKKYIILRYENFNEDFVKIQKKFNFYENLPHVNMSYDPNDLNSTNQHNNMDLKLYRAYYNDETKELIASYFKEDIEQFKYEF